MFTLKKKSAVLAHINIRDEKHGEDNVLAMDLKITLDLPNTFLNEVAPGLLPALYKAEDGQAALLDDGHMPALSFVGMEPVVFNTGIVDADFVIHGAKKEDNIAFKAKIKKITLDCKQGGTVAVMFKAQVLPEPDQAGLLPVLLGNDIKVSVSGGAMEPPAGDDQDGGEE